MNAFGGTIVTQVLVVICGTVSGLLTARYLGPSGRGQLAAISVWPGALSAVAGLGIHQAVVFHTARRPMDAGNILLSAVNIGLIVSAVTVALGAALLHVISATREAFVSSLLLLLTIPFSLLGGYPVSTFQGLGRFRMYNILRVSTPVIYALGVLGLAFSRHATVRLTVIVLALSQVLTAICSWIFVLPIIKHRPAATKELWPLLRFGLPAHAGGLSSFLNQRVDQLVLSLLVPSVQLGFYTVAVTITQGLTFIPFAISNVLVTRAAGAEDRTSAVLILRRVTYATALLFGLICAVTWFILPRLLVVLFGGRYEPSVLAAKILLPGTFFWGMGQLLYAGANSLNRPAISFYAEVVALVLTGVGIAVTVSRFGYIGAAWVSTMSYTLSCAIAAFLLVRAARVER